VEIFSRLGISATSMPISCYDEMPILTFIPGEIAPFNRQTPREKMYKEPAICSHS
jgi:hypothetical protein